MSDNNNKLMADENLEVMTRSRKYWIDLWGKAETENEELRKKLEEANAVMGEKDDQIIELNNLNFWISNYYAGEASKNEMISSQMVLGNKAADRLIELKKELDEANAKVAELKQRVEVVDVIDKTRQGWMYLCLKAEAELDKANGENAVLKQQLSDLRPGFEGVAKFWHDHFIKKCEELGELEDRFEAYGKNAAEVLANTKTFWKGIVGHRNAKIKKLKGELKAAKPAAKEQPKPNELNADEERIKTYQGVIYLAKRGYPIHMSLLAKAGFTVYVASDGRVTVSYKGKPC